jgi:hypothetical protein
MRLLKMVIDHVKPRHPPTGIRPRARVRRLPWNPLLKEFSRHMRHFQKIRHSGLDEESLDPIRIGVNDLTLEYAYAIPNRKAIEALVAWSPLVEMGAGTGYWAKVIHESGGRIAAFDIDPPPDPKNAFDFCRLHYPVQQGTVEILNAFPEIDRHTLFLCWPPNRSCLASEALRAFRGRRVAYIGEGLGGRTADFEFHQELRVGWTLQRRLDIPRWPSIRDSLFLYCRAE